MTGWGKACADAQGAEFGTTQHCCPILGEAGSKHACTVIPPSPGLERGPKVPKPMLSDGCKLIMPDKRAQC